MLFDYTMTHQAHHGIAIDHNRQYLKVFAEFYYNYSMLVVNSFGLQNALERSPVDLGHFFARCHSCAMTCSMLVRDKIAPLGYLKYSPDSHFVMISYAVLSLLKVARPSTSTATLLMDFILLLAGTTRISSLSGS